jgi:two-component system cell cycle sensor histidine kinase/response regulator CckA
MPISHTILLVDDHPMVREVVARILRICGYRVLEANKGADALRLLDDYKDPIHLLLTDVLMPEMNGVELAEQVAALRPGIRVLYMSAYTSDLLEQLRPQADASFIQKPFTLDHLAKKVREVLGSHP